MKRYAIILILTLAAKIGFAQQTNITELARFVISDVRLNDRDVTQQYINANAYLVFYRINGSDQVYFANVWPNANTQSYGRIYNIETTQKSATDTECRNETLSFKWSYINTYDKKEGTASMILGLIDKPNGTTFLLTMMPETLDVIVIQGYLSGSLNIGQ